MSVFSCNQGHIMFCISTASQIVYSIVKGNEDGAFELVPGTGTGILKTNVTLDWTDESNVRLCSHDALIFHSF